MTTTPEQIADLTKAHSDAHQDLLDFSSSLQSRVNTAEQNFNSWKSSAFTSEEASLNVAIGSKKVINLTHLNAATFYPVILSGDANHVNEYEISRYYAQQIPGEDYAGLFLKFGFVGDSWGGNPITLMIHRCEQTYRVTAGALGYANYFKAIVFLRGGYLYHLTSNNRNQKFTIYETQTRYFHDPKQPQHDSFTGPVDEATAKGSIGGLGIKFIYNTLHNKYLPNLGG